MTASNTINKGIAQGIIIGDVYAPNDSVSIITVKIKDNRVNPKTGTKNNYNVQFNAFGELARFVKYNCKKGQVVFVEYYLSTNKKTNNNGITEFYKNRIITDILIGENISEKTRSVPYINEGYIQGEFVSVKPLPRTENIFSVTVRLNMEIENKEFIFYPNFIVFKPLSDSIEKQYNPGDYICLGFKIETDQKVIENKKQYFTNYVITKIL